MQAGTRDETICSDPWQIDPVTARIRPTDGLHDPVIVVVERNPSLSVVLGEVCDFLRIAIISINDPRQLADIMVETQPIAVLHEATSVDCALYDLLMVVAGCDTDLPMLVILPEDPRQHSALEAAVRLWQLTDVVHGQRPGIRELIDFFFRAGGKFGRTRFMPI